MFIFLVCRTSFMTLVRCSGHHWFSGSLADGDSTVTMVAMRIEARQAHKMSTMQALKVLPGNDLFLWLSSFYWSKKFHDFTCMQLERTKAQTVNDYHGIIIIMDHRFCWIPHSPFLELYLPLLSSVWSWDEVFTQDSSSSPLLSQLSPSGH